MDTTMAFIVSFGMAVTGQAASDAEQLQFEAEKGTPSQSEARLAKTRKRIELTNQWSRQLRQGTLHR